MFYRAYLEDYLDILFLACYSSKPDPNKLGCVANSIFACGKCWLPMALVSSWGLPASQCPGYSTLAPACRHLPYKHIVSSPVTVLSPATHVTPPSFPSPSCGFSQAPRLLGTLGPWHGCAQGGTAKSSSASCLCSCLGSAQETKGDICHCWSEKKRAKKNGNRKVAGLKYVVVEQQLLPASVSRSQSNAGVMAQGLIRMRGCPRKQCWFSSEPLTPHLSFPPREAVQLAGARAAEVPLLLEAALPGEVMLAWWGARGSPRAGCPPHTAVTLGLLLAGGQGPGARVREPGGIDVPDQSGGRG